MKEIIRSPTFADIASKKISKAVFSGEIALDQPLRENMLMSELGVSRSTVREALLLLQKDGLVSIIPHRGAYVNNVRGQQILESYTLRAILEPYAGDLAMRRQAFDEQVVEKLHKLIKEMRESQCKGNLFRTIAADADFHLTICKASGHELLVGIFEGLLTRTRLCIMGVLLCESTIELDAEDHVGIVTAIEKRDSSMLSKNLKDHLTKAMQAYYVWNREDGSDVANEKMALMCSSIECGDKEST